MYCSKRNGERGEGGTAAVFRQQIYIGAVLPPPRTKLSQGTGHTPGDLEGRRSKRGFFPFGWGGKGKGKEEKEEVSLQDRLQAQSASLYLGKARQLEYCRR